MRERDTVAHPLVMDGRSDLGRAGVRRNDAFEVLRESYRGLAVTSGAVPGELGPRDAQRELGEELRRITGAMGRVVGRGAREEVSECRPWPVLLGRHHRAFGRRILYAVSRTPRSRTRDTSRSPRRTRAGC